ncbi:MAG TPA: thioredoxin domain-containing protein [Chloroflexia bacterium]|nr:thioredoxin domain-containing protein [Chloroflexia bacterium]
MANQNKSKQNPQGERTRTNGNLKTAQPQPSQPANAGGQRKLTPRQEAALRRQRQRQRNQLLIIGGIVVVAAAAILAIIFSVSQPPATFESLPAAATTDQRPLEIGPADAKVTVEEYLDYQCPACKQWHDQNQQTLLSTYINSGKSVKYVIRPYPFLDARNPEPESHNEVQAAYCAADQSRFWDFHNAMYSNQRPTENSGFWTFSHLKDLAKALNLDTGKFNSCLDSNKYKSKADQDATDAVQRGVTGTPTFFVNNKMVTTKDSSGTEQSSVAYSDLQKAIDAALGSAK